MTKDEAIKVIRDEKLGKYSFDGQNISENLIGIRYLNNVWEVYSTSEKGNVEVITTYEFQEKAIDHMIKGLRVEKRIKDRYNH